METFTLSWSISKNAPASATNEYQNRYGIIAIPPAYRTANQTISWTRTRSSSNVSNFQNDLHYKATNIGDTYFGIHSTQSGSFTLDLSNSTMLGFRLASGYTRNAYVLGGAATLTNSASCSVTITLPWNSRETEVIITAEKLNELANAAGASASATAGTVITRSQYLTVGTKKGITFNTTFPLLSDLSALAATFSGWHSTSTTDYNNI